MEITKQVSNYLISKRRKLSKKKKIPARIPILFFHFHAYILKRTTLDHASLWEDPYPII